MLSEFEGRRRKRILDDFFMLMEIEQSESDIVCPECLSGVFRLNFDLGIVCADPDCEAVIDFEQLKNEDE